MLKIDWSKEIFPLILAVVATVAVMGVAVGFSPRGTDIAAMRIASAAGFFILVWALARDWK